MFTEVAVFIDNRDVVIRVNMDAGETVENALNNTRHKSLPTPKPMRATRRSGLKERCHTCRGEGFISPLFIRSGAICPECNGQKFTRRPLPPPSSPLSRFYAKRLRGKLSKVDYACGGVLTLGILTAYYLV